MIAGASESSLDRRIASAIQWLADSAQDDNGGGRGWGWVPDVPPNPQNTAEVVWALTLAGTPTDRADAIATHIDRDAIAFAAGQAWSFDGYIDLAWRLRALRCLRDEDHASICTVAEKLVAARTPDGAWCFGDEDSAPSVLVTATAVLALLDLSSVGEAAVAARDGVQWLARAGLQAGSAAPALHSQAIIAQTLSDPRVDLLYEPDVDAAKNRCIRAIVRALRRGDIQIESEVFVRNGRKETWRHLTLGMCLQGIVDASPARLLDPPARRALIELLALQDQDPVSASYGAFRTSREGFVTSFATAQAISLMIGMREALAGRINPGRTFDMLAALDGAHHTDPQLLVTVRNRAIRLNSGGGLLLAGIAAAGSATSIGVTVAERHYLGSVVAGVVAAWSTYLFAFAAWCALAVRLPDIPSRRLASAVFLVSTGIVVPLLVPALQ